MFTSDYENAALSYLDMLIARQIIDQKKKWKFENDSEEYLTYFSVLQHEKKQNSVTFSFVTIDSETTQSNMSNLKTHVRLVFIKIVK